MKCIYKHVRFNFEWQTFGQREDAKNSQWTDNVDRHLVFIPFRKIYSVKLLI